METESKIGLSVCPNCKTEGPKTKFCLNCGSPKIIEVSEKFSLNDEENDSDDVSVEVIEDEPKRDTFLSIETTLKKRRAKAPKIIKSKFKKKKLNLQTSHVKEIKDTVRKNELDPLIKENMLNLLKSIDLKIWLVDLFLKGNVEEEHFINMFGDYESRLEQCMKLRNQMMENTRNLKPIKKGLNEAQLLLAELERKKIIGDISDEEYNLKSPVYKWDINKFEKELVSKKAETAILEDFTSVMPEEDIAGMKEMAKNSLDAVEDLLKSGDINPDTAKRIKESLKKIISIFKQSR